MSDVELDADGALRQAGITADHYLNVAIEILNSKEYTWNIKDAIELAKVMATDFDTAMMCTKIQEIRDALLDISSGISNE